ncbi:MAG: MmgE/PrpD family protein [Burkholderiales bacterium]|nr:MmgE/PrpD family protein [Burkholderiales bacterium]
MSRPAYLDTAAEFIVRTKLADLSAEALERGRWIVADCIPVIAAGMQTAEMKAFVASHLAVAAPGDVWVIGSGRRAAALDAGLLNGTAGTWLELDEGNLFAKGHPGIQVVPAALAVAQERGSSGAELLLASTLGYEICARISRASSIRLTIHPHGTYGVIGAAVAVGKLKGFDAARMRELINVAATMGMATSRNTLLEGSTVRNIYTGHSAYMGQIAARLVECGFTGEPDGVGFVYGKVLSDTFDADRVVAGLGSEWLVAKNYFKLHCTGRYVHSAIDALEDALARAPGGCVDAGAIERIDVAAYSLAAMLAGKQITTSFGARFSIPFALATILHHGRSGTAEFEQAAVDDPAVQALVAKVFVRHEAAYDAAFPERQLCDVHIRMKDGTTYTGRCEVTKGEPANPHSPADLEGKFMRLGAPVWGEARARELHAACMRLESIADFGAFAQELSL